MADVDRCVVCGAPVPEGRMVCPGCEQVKHCESCKWHDEFTGACYNPKSKHFTSATKLECYCDQWEGYV